MDVVPLKIVATRRMAEFLTYYHSKLQPILCHAELVEAEHLLSYQEEGEEGGRVQTIWPDRWVVHREVRQPLLHPQAGRPLVRPGTEPDGHLQGPTLPSCILPGTHDQVHTHQAALLAEPADLIIYKHTQHTNLSDAK